MIEQIRQDKKVMEQNFKNNRHLNELDTRKLLDAVGYLIGEVALWKEKEFQACSMHHEYHEDIEKLESQIAELKRALERIAVTFERGEMVRIAYETLRSIKGVETE